MDHVIRQILVQIGQAIRILTQTLVLPSQPIARRNLPELPQIDHVQSADVVLAVRQMHLPVAGLPEAEAVHLPLGVAEGRVAVRRALEVHVAQLGEVGLDNLVGVDVDDLLDAEREEDVQEEDLVAPDDALLLGLLVEPAGPLVLHQLVVEAVLLGVVRQELGELRRQTEISNRN